MTALRTYQIFLQKSVFTPDPKMSAYIFSIQLDCPQCSNGLVNRDERLVLHARHPGIDESCLTYTWTLYRVVLDDTTLADRGELILLICCFLLWTQDKRVEYMVQPVSPHSFNAPAASCATCTLG